MFQRELWEFSHFQNQKLKFANFSGFNEFGFD